MVGYNRRFSSHAVFIKKIVSQRKDPLCAIFTVNAGPVPLDHWSQDEEVGGGRLIGEACHYIDFLRYITESPIVGVGAVGTKGHSGTDSDKVSISLAFKDGSLGIVNYFANGSRAYPKESVEFFFEGRTIFLDNFHAVRVYGGKKSLGFRPMFRDKGYKGELCKFLSAIKDGLPCPIVFSQILEVALTSILAVKSLQNGCTINIEEKMSELTNCEVGNVS